MIEFTIGEALCIPRFMTLAQTNQILGRGGMIRPSPWLRLIKKARAR